MEDFFKDIFEYHYQFNQRLIKQLNTIEEILPNRTIPLISHAINAHQIWNARITKSQELGVHQVHSLKICLEIDNSNYQQTLKILNERKLNEIIKYENTQGTTFENSIRQILFHISNHYSHHKGQIISDIRQIGIDPIITDYIFYKRQSD
tara:strand:+ start:78 stop:527 length:450 start_codon:yes stop_codon:yes gene_type:complete